MPNVLIHEQSFKEAMTRRLLGMNRIEFVLFPDTAKDLCKPDSLIQLGYQGMGIQVRVNRVITDIESRKTAMMAIIIN